MIFWRFVVDFIRKILSFFTNKSEVDGMVVFSHEMLDDGSERLITVHADREGFVIMTIFTPEEWEMVLNVVELTGSKLEDVICGLVEDNNITTISFDPKDFI